jgi:SNF2 family DNA or RNA helicase
VLPVKIDKAYVYVKTPFIARDAVQRDLNGVWSKKEGMYRFPKNLHMMAELLEYFPELKASNQFMNAGMKLRAIREMFLDMKRPTDAPGDERLRPYQRVDVQYLKKMPSAGIFNEPRTGKTPTSIVLMKELKTKANMVVCPASLLFNWEKEIRDWYPELKTFVVNGTPKKKEDAIKACYDYSGHKVLIVSKDTWKGLVKKWGNFSFDTVFVDEAHFLRSRDTQQSKAIKAIQAKRKYALTGTPAVKGTQDVYGILEFLFPDKYKSYWQFVERYFEQRENWMGKKEIVRVKSKRKAELEETIGFSSVQRKRKDVMQWLPDKVHQTIYLEMESKQRKAYEEMQQWFFTQDEDGNEIDTPDILAQMTRMRQICLDPALVNLSVDSVKTKFLVEWLQNNNEPVVIMSMFTSYLKRLKPVFESMGKKVGMIHGEMSNKEKFEQAQGFQAGKIDVLLCNIISAGTGFTLDRAEVIIFTDKAWNPSDNEQAEDRITPTTKEKVHSHTIISLVCRGTFDETINTMLSEKKSLTDIINSGGMKSIKALLRGDRG